MKEPPLKLIPVSEVARLKKSGYEPLAAGDASQANCDYFMVFVKKSDSGQDIRIVCPTFLRGSLGISEIRGGLSY